MYFEPFDYTGNVRVLVNDDGDYFDNAIHVVAGGGVYPLNFGNWNPGAITYSRQVTLDLRTLPNVGNIFFIVKSLPSSQLTSSLEVMAPYLSCINFNGDGESHLTYYNEHTIGFTPIIGETTVAVPIRLYTFDPSMDQYLVCDGDITASVTNRLETGLDEYVHMGDWYWRDDYTTFN